MQHTKVTLVRTIHTTWVCVVLLCLPLAFTYPHLHIAILFFLGFTLLTQIPYLKCPLTVWENRFRGSEAYHGTFLKFYLHEWFGISVSDMFVHILSTVYFVGTILIAVFYKLHTAF